MNRLLLNLRFAWVLTQVAWRVCILWPVLDFVCLRLDVCLHNDDDRDGVVPLSESDIEFTREVLAAAEAPHLLEKFDDLVRVK